MIKKNRGDRILFGLLFFTYAFFYQGGWDNQNSRFDFTLAMAFQHRSNIDAFHVNTIDKASFLGHYFSEKAPGLSYLALPIPLLSSQFIKLETLFEKQCLADLLLYFATVFTVSIISALSALSFRRLLILLDPTCSYLRSFWITLVIYSTTCILPYSTTLMGHQLVGSLLVIALYFGLSDLTGEDGIRQFVNYSISCFCLGYCVFSEFPSLILVAGVGTVIFIRSENKRRLLQAAPFCMIPLIMLLVHNYIIFHSFVSMGYGKLEGTRFSENMSHGFFGIQLPSVANFYQLLFGFYRGLFIYSPTLLIATASFFYWPKDLFRKVGFPLLLSVIGTVLLISGYTYWQGGAVFGPRHLVACIPLIGLGFVYMPSGWSRLSFVRLLVAVSAVINVIGTATTLYVSETDTLPLFHSYFDLARSGAVAVNPISFLDSFVDQEWQWESLQRLGVGSFNYGTLMGLRGWNSLFVLFVVWCIGLVMFYHLYLNSQKPVA